MEKRKRVLICSLKKGFNNDMMNLHFFKIFFPSENMVKFFVEKNYL